MPWNAGPHRRKFIKSHGSIVSPDGTVTFEGPLVFWGEWEPPSLIERRWTGKRGFPTVLHDRAGPIPGRSVSARIPIPGYSARTSSTAIASS